MINKGLSRVFIALFAVSMVTGPMVYAQGAGNIKAAENLLSLLDRTDEKVLSLFDEVYLEESNVPPDTQALYDEAYELGLDALELYEAGEYHECIEVASEALNKYGSLITELQPIGEPEPQAQNVLEERETLMGLFVAIERSRNRISELREISVELGEQDVDTGEASSLLDEAELVLDDLESTLESGEYNGTEINLGEANRLIGLATGLLKNRGHPKKQEKAEKFINNTIRRMERLQRNMNNLFLRRGVSKPGINRDFEGIITGLRDLELDTDMHEAVRRIRNLIKASRQIGVNNGHGFNANSIKVLNSQTRLEEIIEEYRGLVEAIEGEHEQIPLLNELLDKAEENLLLSMDALEADDESLAEDYLDEVEATLEEFDNTYEEYFDQSRGKKPKAYNNQGKNPNN